MANAETAQTENSWRWLVGCGGTVLALVVLGGLLWWRLGLVLLVNPTGTLAATQSRWDAAAVDTYTLTVSVEQPFDENVVYEIYVEGGMVVEATRINPGAYRFSADPNRFTADPSEVTGYTIDGLFNTAARVMRDLPNAGVTGATGTHVRYNPNDHYPRLIVENRCGLLFSSIDECLTRIEVLAFTPEPSPQT